MHENELQPLPARETRAAGAAGTAVARESDRPGKERRRKQEDAKRKKPKRKKKEKEAKAKKDRKDEKKRKRKDRKKAEKKQKRKKVRRTARTADRHELYQLSVQAPDVDAPFFARYHKRVVGRPARVLREDFCGTAFLATHWVRMHRENHAIGVDLHGPTLEWGRRRNVAGLTDAQRARLCLVQADVLEVRTDPCDVLVALNFSYSVFKTRDVLRAYLSNARRDIAPGGLIILDAWGGGDTHTEMEEERKIEDFTYVWDQHDFDPVSHRTDCRIHFRFKDGSELKNAFRYDWRHWTLPEMRELMAEAGFEDIHVLWEGTDSKTGDGNGVYRRRDRGDPDPAWITYVVGRA